MRKDEFGFFDTATLIKDGKINLDYYMQNLSYKECIEKCQWWHLDIPKYFNLFCPYCQKTTTYEVAPQVYFEDERVLGMIGVCKHCNGIGKLWVLNPSERDSEDCLFQKAWMLPKPIIGENKIKQQLSGEAKKLLLDKNLSVLPLCIP
jgi:hypothetical protein